MAEPANLPHDALIDTRHEHGEPSAIGAVERAVEAAQRIAFDRLELMRLEATEALTTLMQTAGMALGAGMIVLLGWSGIAVAVALWLSQRLPTATSVAIVGGVHLLLGMCLAAYALGGRRRKTT